MAKKKPLNKSYDLDDPKVREELVRKGKITEEKFSVGKRNFNVVSVKLN